LLPAVICAQPVDTMFVRRYSSPGYNPDILTDMVLAPNGNVYLTGTGHSPANYDDYWTVACDRWGNKLWDAFYGGANTLGDSADAIALDSRGDLYVTGVTTEVGLGSMTTLKYRSDSTLLWANTLYFPSDTDDGGIDIVTQDTTAVYACGWRHKYGTDYDYLVVKYDPLTGDTLWTRSYNRPGEADEDIPVAIAVDHNGNVIVTGYSYSTNTDYDYCTMKYSPDGTLLWQRFYDYTPSHDEDQPMALAVDASNAVVVTGYSYSENTDYDIATVRYGTNGDTSFAARYNRVPANSDDEGCAVVTDPFNNVYVTGFSYDTGSDYDYTMLKYNSSGTQQWLQRYDHNGCDDEACAMALDGALNVFATGFTVDPVNDDDVVTVKLNGTNGAFIWAHTYDDPMHSADDPERIACGANGLILVGAQVPGDTTDVDYALLRLYEQTHDCGPVAITAPVDTVFTTDTLVPKIVLHNYGMYAETVLVQVTIAPGYQDTLRHFIDVGNYDTLSFTSLIESLVGVYPVRCTSILAADVDPLNNAISDSFIVTTLTGIRQDPHNIVVIKPYLQIAPNPAVSRASIQYAVPDPEHLSLKVYDAGGRMVRNLSAGSARRTGALDLDLKGLAAGIYVVKLDTPRERFTRKLIIER
jgi:uncharacterized delta-60 repeat protein